MMLTGAIAVVGREVLITGGDLVLDEPHDVRQGEGSAARPARERVRRDAGCRRPSAFCRAVRIR